MYVTPSTDSTASILKVAAIINYLLYSAIAELELLLELRLLEDKLEELLLDELLLELRLLELEDLLLELELLDDILFAELLLEEELLLLRELLEEELLELAVTVNCIATPSAHFSKFITSESVDSLVLKCSLSNNLLVVT